ncbi:MAG: alpha/beta hydrolase [Planctomycetales bacterium]|nr:alpha/beta hydrolase [Planctomycetales bacterium]
MPRIDLKELTVHYQQHGEGDDVILIHAFTSNLAVWLLTPTVQRLAEHFRVTAYDLRGHGLTSVTRHGYTSGSLATDLHALHDKLKLNPAFLVGHSFGGVIGLRAALEFPAMVRGVVLSDAYFPGLQHLEPQMGQAEPWRELRDTFAQVDVDLGPTVDFTKLFEVVRGLDEDRLASLRTGMGAPGARWLSQMGQLADTHAGTEMFAVDGLTAERICQVTQPVVALYDEHSPFSATCEFLQQNLPLCAVDIVPGARHLAPVQSPVEFAELVHRHLRRLQSTNV